MTREELVMLHYDGELDTERTREAEALLARDPRARELLEQLCRVGSVLREADATRPHPADLTPQIMERVFGPESGRVVSVARPPSAKVRSGRALAWVSGGLALAAGLALLLGPRAASKSVVPSSRAVVSQVAPLRVPVSPLEPEGPEQAVAVESVDFGSSQGAIFLVPSADSPMLVVWTLDDDADRGRKVDL